MSMTGVGCLNHNLQHDTSQNPSESPIATLTVNPSRYQAGAAHPCDHWPQYSR